MITSWRIAIRWCAGLLWVIGVIGMQVGLIRYTQFMAPLTTSYYDHNILLYFGEHILFLLLLVFSGIAYHQRWRLGWMSIAGIAGLLVLTGVASRRPIGRFRGMLDISLIPQPSDNTWAQHYHRSLDGPEWMIGGAIAILIASVLYLGVGTYDPNQQPRAYRWTWILWLLGVTRIAVGIVVFAWFDTILAQLHVDASFIEAGFWTHIQFMIMSVFFCFILGMSALVWWNIARSCALPALWVSAVVLILITVTTSVPLDTYHERKSNKTTPISLKQSIALTYPVYHHAHWLMMTGAWSIILLSTGWKLHDVWRDLREHPQTMTPDTIPPSTHA
ncbi:hypothetical protein Haur_1347 [Herpetosiphon aurantiacus DSM 785]|uniref:Uncharacterized protein n=1 Tax=Herpetosiphon aurantiacus (strain ATCC 23779 / DSM 785 / 114-95) TaxID=316274 RepID=A9B2E7_HERA2|nr:hypothetical protein Haur_1347 [Herpetosiphon aurantiacus DSM 785]